MKTPVFTGLATAIVTPFGEGGVNYPKLAEIIEFQINGGVDAIVACGTTGESSTQSLEEHIEVVDFCVRRVAGRVKVIAGAGSNDTQAAALLSREAEKSGADALLHVTPYYNKTTQRGLVAHFTHIADSVSIPVILYNVPSRTAMTISAGTYAELSRHPNINGVKEASGNIPLVAAVISACGDDLYVWSGNDDETVALMALGAKGLISTSANVIPAQMTELTHLCLDGDYAGAARLLYKYLDLMEKLFIEVNPIPVKTAMNLMGMDVGELRLPLCGMAPDNLEKLKAAMRAAGLLPEGIT
ncbi:MAG: 4-hydroxy-tetrahydrodipicolinate synthase [Oscillospiraceae bacterium]|jgi:4-hydroxy-tetrahydrodipicolinate synthase|nr:4-hydroxy-tetrahydrodipicolinate synthase [Oscillospiraceae bacterium]